MDDAERQRLLDIVEHAEELARHLHGVTKERFLAEKGLRRIAERLLEICGEAADNLTDGTRKAIGADWRGLQRMRILLAHAYPRVDPEALWSAATKSLLALAAAVSSYLEFRPT